MSWAVGGLCNVKGVGREVRQVGDAPLEATTAHPGGESSGTKLRERGGDRSWGRLWMGQCRETRAEPSSLWPPDVKMEVGHVGGGPGASTLFAPPRTVGSPSPLRRMTTAASLWMATCSAGNATPPEPRLSEDWPPSRTASPFPHQRTTHGGTTSPSPSPQLFFDLQPLPPYQTPPQSPSFPYVASGLQSPSPGVQSPQSCRDHPPSSR